MNGSDDTNRGFVTAYPCASVCIERPAGAGGSNSSCSAVYDPRYIDAPAVVYRDTNMDGTVDEKLYVTQDANFNVTSTVNADSGSVVNRFVYTPYGQRTVLTSTWSAGTSDFSLGHQGLMLDSESGMYYNRARYYHPTLGRFIQRDPLGYVDGGSLYEYERSVPTDARDPLGFWSGGKRRIQDEISKLEGLVLNLRRKWYEVGTFRQRSIIAQIVAVEKGIEKLRQKLALEGHGHSDLPGGSEFDWNLEDDDPETSPFRKPGNHFQPLELSESEVDAAIKSCNREAFQRAIHRGQDYFSHYRPGYRWDPGRGEYGHAFHIDFIDTWFGPIGYISLYPTDVDDAQVHRQAFEDAAAWTQEQLARWNCACS